MPEPRFTLSENQPPVEIANVGLLDAAHEITLERAAERMPELQDEDGKPLSGPELHDAARAWCEHAEGVEVADTPAEAGDDSGQPVAGADAPVEQQSPAWLQQQPAPDTTTIAPSVAPDERE